MNALTSRLATPGDAGAIVRIYNQSIEDCIATFETRLRVEADVRAWFGTGHPIVLVEDAHAPIAFAASSAFRARECYAGVAEMGVYVARERRGQGAGRRAVEALAAACEAAGFWKLLAGVIRENMASLRMLRGAGFREVGTYEKHGRVEGRFRDVVLLERLLGDAARPTMVLFVCVHNAARSQMARAFFEARADPRRAFARSAGIDPGAVVLPEVLEAMREAGLDLSRARPQDISATDLEEAGLLVTFGAGGPFPPRLAREDWAIEDPGGETLPRVRTLRDAIEARVLALLDQRRWLR